MKSERSDAQKMGYYKTCLRSLWRTSPMRWDAWRRARVAPGVLKCAKCGEEGNAKLYEIDHINPVVDPEIGDEGIATWVYRLNCHSDALQALCEMCHKAKTTAEHKLRHKNGTGPFSVDALASKSDPVVAINLATGETLHFVSQRAAAQKLNVDEGNLAHVVQGSRNSLGGWTFQRVKKGLI